MSEVRESPTAPQPPVHECQKCGAPVDSILDLNEVVLTIGPPSAGLYSRSLACGPCAHRIYAFVHPLPVGAQAAEPVPLGEGRPDGAG